MILWSIQDIAVWKQLEETGVYTTSTECIGFPENEGDATCHCNYAYRWLASQMAKRIGPPPEGVENPIWAWYKQHGRADGKPDMRSEYREKGKMYVRMKLDVPDWEVLVTDFDSWHYPLNYWYLSTTEQDSILFDSWCESLGVEHQDIANWDLTSPELELVRARVEQSWERMIGIHPEDEDWRFPWKLRSFQATFWVLRREYVLGVEAFGAR